MATTQEFRHDMNGSVKRAVNDAQSNGSEVPSQREASLKAEVVRHQEEPRTTNDSVFEEQPLQLLDPRNSEDLRAVRPPGGIASRSRPPAVSRPVWSASTNTSRRGSGKSHPQQHPKTCVTRLSDGPETLSQMRKGRQSLEGPTKDTRSLPEDQKHARSEYESEVSKVMANLKKLHQSASSVYPGQEGQQVKEQARIAASLVSLLKEACLKHRSSPSQQMDPDPSLPATRNSSGEIYRTPSNRLNVAKIETPGRTPKNQAIPSPAPPLSNSSNGASGTRKSAESPDVLNGKPAQSREVPGSIQKLRAKRLVQKGQECFFPRTPKEDAEMVCKSPNNPLQRGEDNH